MEVEPVVVEALTARAKEAVSVVVAVAVVAISVTAEAEDGEQVATTTPVVPGVAASPEVSRVKTDVVLRCPTRVQIDSVGPVPEGSP